MCGSSTDDCRNCFDSSGSLSSCSSFSSWGFKKYFCHISCQMIGINSDGNVFTWSPTDPRLRRIKGLKDFVSAEITETRKPEKYSLNSLGRKGKKNLPIFFTFLSVGIFWCLNFWPNGKFQVEFFDLFRNLCSSRSIPRRYGFKSPWLLDFFLLTLSTLSCKSFIKY